MSRRANLLFGLVVGGYVISIFVIAAGVGIYIPAQSQADANTTILISAVASAVQMYAFYVTAGESAHKYAWSVGLVMIGLTALMLILSIVSTSIEPHTINYNDVAQAVLAALISCGALIWLRRKPAARR